MDYRCNLNNMDNMAHFIIYGHNPEDTTYFSDLFKYEKEDFFKNHKTIYMSTINGNYKWQIFSVYKTTPDFFYIDVNFDTVTEYSTFLDSLKEKVCIIQILMLTQMIQSLLFQLVTIL